MIPVKENKATTLEIKNFDGIPFYQITNHDKMPAFFMTILSSSNHWMFISSNGALSAGRKNADYALFPYYTEDKITESVENTGCKTIIKGIYNQESFIWEPFSTNQQTTFSICRNLYKSVYGNQIIFEEINETLQITFRYQWSNTEQFGFVRKATLDNWSTKTYDLVVLDGLQNILPAGVGSDLQNFYSNLVDAYKSSELVEEVSLGIYALSAVIVDRAEPSEALKANTVWSFGLENSKILLSVNQLEHFRTNQNIYTENENKGGKGAYFLVKNIQIKTETKEWFIVANVNQNQSKVVKLSNELKNPYQVINAVLTDIKNNTNSLINLVNTADGIQKTGDFLKDSRHFANVVFNCMRGGVFDKNYQITKDDFVAYLHNANSNLAAHFKQNYYNQLPENFSKDILEELDLSTYNIDFKRLAKEYLPLYFSRRHGDPSRPWNKFSINTQNELDGSKILDYQGNWRDIFQNWEALAYAYPDFVENMIYKFLNASTFEGYNPYRVTKDGFDWEIIEPDDPWAYIGYWGDHQIIYLLKFLEFIENYNPNALQNLFTQESFVYANVPYKIKRYADIVKNPKDTIEFDYKLDEKLQHNKLEFGADALLLQNEKHQIHQVNFIEKILATILSKLSNFIPEAGIWMNTQRPEWNDANNALVGNGVSVVTLCYLRRFMVFFVEILEKSTLEEIKVSQELIDFYKSTRKIFEDNQHLLANKISDTDRKLIVDALGETASSYRWHIYEHGFWGAKRSISLSGLKRFCTVALEFINHTIQANEREDKLYHAYNLASFNNTKISISYLNEMLEGQVAVLSSKFLNAQQALHVLDALRNSSLYRKDQNSYILYPNKKLPSFLTKNTFSKEDIKDSLLLKELLAIGNLEIIEEDVLGKLHFNANFKNASNLKEALYRLDMSTFSCTEEEIVKVLDLYEQIFNHKAFTGRSGTFYGYEGLGSIYWHMVSKLMLATQECVKDAYVNQADTSIQKQLINHYYQIAEGIGVHKSPTVYGAFPTDPYSHTPATKGAQQPGMTGQVKEDIICRWGELGVNISNGTLSFNPFFLSREEFLKTAETYSYYTVNNQLQKINVENQTVAFTFCQTPVIYKISDTNSLEIILNSGEKSKQEHFELPKDVSAEIFKRTGKVKAIYVFINEEQLLNNYK